MPSSRRHPQCRIPVSMFAFFTGIHSIVWHHDVGVRKLIPYIPSLMEEVAVGGGPDFLGYAWMANTMRSLAPLSEKLGIATVEGLGLDSLAERLRHEAVARDLMVWAPPLVGAYSRVP